MTFQDIRIRYRQHPAGPVVDPRRLHQSGPVEEVMNARAAAREMNQRVPVDA